MPQETENIENNADIKNISKIANVEVSLCAELGKAKIAIQDAIEYNEGSIIVLDKNEKEPIDIYVDDILIAKGQIVAVEDSYGIKIVEVIENNK